MTAGGDNAPHPAFVVGYCFVKEYYTQLSTSPENMYKFYKAQSVFNRGVEGGKQFGVSAEGPGDIHSNIMAYAGHPGQVPAGVCVSGGACQTEILDIVSQESRHGGVLVLVTGIVTYSWEGVRRRFTQTFFLDKQTEPVEGFYILNDILRFIDGPAPARDTNLYAQQYTQAQAQMPPQLQAPQHEPQMQAQVLHAPQTHQQAPPTAQPVLPAPGFEAGASAPGLQHQGYSAEAAAQEAGADAADPTEAVVDDLQDEVAGYEEDEAAGEDEGAGEVADDDGAAPESGGQADGVEDALAAEEEEIIEEPKTWASMASKLKKDGGTLATSKVKGFSMPATGPVLPPPSTVTKALASGPALPPPGTKTSVSADAGAASSTKPADGPVRLWLSRIPQAEDKEKENQAVLESVNSALEKAEHAGRATSVDRKDGGKDWGTLVVPNQEVADAVVQLSKDRKLNVQGKSLKVEPPKPQGGGGAGASNNGAANTDRRPRGGGKGDKSDAKEGGDSKGERRGKGGGKRTGGKDGSTEQRSEDRGGASGDGSGRPKGGRKGGGKGGEKGSGGGGGEWRSKAPAASS